MAEPPRGGGVAVVMKVPVRERMSRKGADEPADRENARWSEARGRHIIDFVSESTKRRASGRRLPRSGSGLGGARRAAHNYPRRPSRIKWYPLPDSSYFESTRGLQESVWGHAARPRARQSYSQTSTRRRANVVDRGGAIDTPSTTRAALPGQPEQESAREQGSRCDG